jgi:hypothetical protein
MAFMLSCNFITGLGSGSTEGSVDYDAPADPLNVTVVLNETDSVSGMIPPEGGELTFSSADGNIYTLEVPAGALDVETEIVMTSVESIEGTATGDGLFAVQLEPSGLRFNELVTLSITPAMDVSGEDLMFIKYEGNGEDVHHALVDPLTEEIDVLLLDFSGIGYGTMLAFGTIFRLDADKMVTGYESRRLENALGEATQNLAKEKTKAGKAKVNKEIQKLLDEHKTNYVDKKINDARGDCTKVGEAEEALIELENFRKRFDSNNLNPPGDKKARAEFDKINKGCPRAFSANGDSGAFKISGVICDIYKPFTLKGTGPDGCSSSDIFNPHGGRLSGDYTFFVSGCPFGVTGSGSGPYSISLTIVEGKPIGGKLSGSYTGKMSIMDISGPVSLSLDRIPEDACK